MRPIVLERSFQLALIAGAALMVASCGGHDGNSADGNGSGGASKGGNSGSDSADSANVEGGDPFGNLAEIDTANGTSLNRQSVQTDNPH